MEERELSHVEALMYQKCMRLASEFANRKAKAMRDGGMSFDGKSFGIGNPWCGLWSAYCHGKASEEDVKACFLLGRVAEEFANETSDRQPRRDGPLPHNRLQKHRPLFGGLL